jgi:hypothetical protein
MLSDSGARLLKLAADSQGDAMHKILTATLAGSVLLAGVSAEAATTTTSFQVSAPAT